MTEAVWAVFTLGVGIRTRRLKLSGLSLHWECGLELDD